MEKKFPAENKKLPPKGSTLRELLERQEEGEQIFLLAEENPWLDLGGEG